MENILEMILDMWALYTYNIITYISMIVCCIYAKRDRNIVFYLDLEGCLASV